MTWPERREARDAIDAMPSSLALHVLGQVTWLIQSATDLETTKWCVSVKRKLVLALVKRGPVIGLATSFATHHPRLIPLVNVMSGQPVVK
jgi:hypothetical protein